MIIQPLLFPPAYLKNESELFFRCIDSKNIYDKKVVLTADSILSLGTYFNAFSIGKWMKYTTLDNLSLKLLVKGDIKIEVFHAVGSYDANVYNREEKKHSEEELIKIINEKAYKVTRKKVGFLLSRNGDEYTIKFNNLFSDGVLSVLIKASNNAVLYGGGYISEVDESKLNTVKLAIGVCTYKREEFVISNVKRILSDIITNNESPLKNKVEVYIADNGQTIALNQFDNAKIHIFPGQDLGSAGGFSRVMIEAMFYDKPEKFSHIILMDDDISLYPTVIERNFFILRLLKPKYKKAIIGGASLLLEKPNIQQESGAIYSDSKIYIGKASHKFFDLCKEDAVVANEVSNPANYAGWWYACIPRTIINKNNCPMPFFIHYDDAEYSIRNVNDDLMFINGICVWHPSPQNKNPFWMTYYNTRNRLITMFSKKLCKTDFNKYIVALTKSFILKIIRYEYSDARLMLEGLQDFLKGPNFFASLDAVSRHEELLERKEMLFTPEEVCISTDEIIEKNYSNFKKAVIIQVLCNLLPSQKRICAINTKYYNIPNFANRIYLYNEKKRKGVVNKRDQIEFFKLLFSFSNLLMKLRRSFKQIQKDWQTSKAVFTSFSFWEKYLGLKQEE